MARQTVVNCDQCGEPDAQTFQVTWNDQRWEVDLCERHAKPIVTAAERGHPLLTGTGRSNPATRFKHLEGRIEGV